MRVDELTGRLQCSQCGGFWLTEEAIKKRRSRGSTETRCRDCIGDTSTTILLVPELGRCTPWQGEFDMDSLTCLRNGKPYKQGKRKCGKADCVRQDHIIKQALSDIPDGVSNIIRNVFMVSGVMISIDEAKIRLKQELNDVA